MAAFCFACVNGHDWNVHVAGDFTQTDAGCVRSADFSPDCVRDCPPHKEKGYLKALRSPSLTARNAAPMRFTESR